MKNYLKIIQAIGALPPQQRLLWLKNRLRTAVGIPATLDSLDRHVIEQQILPFYAAQKQICKVLFVGCDWYTKHYGRPFQHADFCTLDADPSQAKYGAARHVIAPLQDIGQHFGQGSLDLILCNGVFGYGLNEAQDLSHAMQQCFSCLRPGGELMLGWNDIPAHAPYDPAPLIEAAGFVRKSLVPLGQWRTMLAMPTRHTFEAYGRP